jgi:hypothetical protein
MKAAGYDVDLDKYVAMKIQDITPEYAAAMGQLGFGKLSADDLIACKVQGVTPEFISGLKQGGIEVKTIHDAISYRIFEVSPEFVTKMKEAGFANLTSQQLLAMRVQGVTPEYARTIVQQYPGATAEDIVKTKIFNIDAAFIEQKRRGLNDAPRPGVRRNRAIFWSHAGAAYVQNSPDRLDCRTGCCSTGPPCGES